MGLLICPDVCRCPEFAVDVEIFLIAPNITSYADLKVALASVAHQRPNQIGSPFHGRFFFISIHLHRHLVDSPEQKH